MLSLLHPCAFAPTVSSFTLKVKPGNPHGLEMARDAMRAGVGAGLKREVHLPAGFHFIRRPFELDERDSATVDAPIIYTTAPEDVALGKYAQVSGGIAVPAAAFKPVDVPSGATGVFVADLFALGLNTSSLGGLGSGQYPRAKLELFYDSEPQLLARDPNLGTDSLRTWQWAGYEAVKISANRSLVFDDAERGAMWQQALHGADGALWLHGYWKFDWRDGFVRVESIEELNSSLYNITLTADSHPGYPPVVSGWTKTCSLNHLLPASRPTVLCLCVRAVLCLCGVLHRGPHIRPQDGCRFYALNALRLLDAPGEYYVSNDGKLYFYPPGGAVVADAVVSVQDHVMLMSGVAHHTFRDLVLSTSQQETVLVSSSVNVSFINCTISNSGGTGACLTISGSNNTVSRSAISGCGGAGISVSGGDEKLLQSGNNTVANNSISNFSRIVRTYHPGVGERRGGIRILQRQTCAPLRCNGHHTCTRAAPPSLGTSGFEGVGLHVAFNNISHAPHACLNGGGSNHLFEHNRLEHCVYECIDAGAFYVGRSWGMRGNVVRFNIFETVRPTERLAQKSCSQNAFYLDDQMSGYDFYGNTVINATQGMLLGGGRHNRVHSNTFIACDIDIAFDDRGLNWQAASCARNCSATMGTSTTSCFYNKLRDLDYTQPPWATAFPEVVSIYDEHPCTPVGNVIEDNVYCHHGSTPGKGTFIDRTPDQIHSWYSSISNNREACP